MTNYQKYQLILMSVFGMLIISFLISHHKKIEELEKSIKSTRGDVEWIESDVYDLKDSVGLSGSNSDELEGLKNKIRSLGADLEDIEGKISWMQNDIDELRHDVDEIQ